MQINIDITSEQLVKLALNRYKTQQETPDLLLGNMIAEIRGAADSATFIRQAVINSIAEGIQRMERQALAAESEFASIGQMSLLGEVIPYHEIPGAMQTRSVAEVNSWMENRAEVEKDNLEEIRRAFDRQERKTTQYANWAAATRKVYDVLKGAGMDPAKVSYAEAVNKAEILQ